MRIGIFVAATALLAGAVMSPAAPAGSVARLRARASGLVSEFVTLNLSNGQLASIKGIIVDSQKQIHEIRTGTGAPLQKREAVANVEKDLREQMVQLLTPEQRARLKTWRNSHPGMLGLGSLVGKVEALDLTGAQKAQILGYLQDAKSKGEALRRNAGVTPIQKRAEGRELLQSLRQQVLGVLTAAQRMEWKEDRNGRE